MPAALERHGAGSPHDSFALAIGSRPGLRLEPIARRHHDVALHVEIGLVLADPGFVTGRHESLALANRRDFCGDQPRAAVGIRVLFVGLDTNCLALAFHLHEECAGAFDGRGRVATFDRHGRRRLFPPARREEDDRDNTYGYGQDEQARTLLPNHGFVTSFDRLRTPRACRRASGRPHVADR